MRTRDLVAGFSPARTARRLGCLLPGNAAYLRGSRQDFSDALAIIAHAFAGHSL
ncbi:MAG: hypothetical protein P8Y36_12835 [Alphaproteobacteria bacterium]